MHQPGLYSLFAAIISLFVVDTARADLGDDAHATARRATQFLTEKLSTRGGYLWRYAADLSLREGEGVVTSETIWIQPPGTPSVGEAFLRLHAATGDALFLRAARRAGEALRRGQMRSGGWQAMIEFEPQRRKRWAYRVDPVRAKAKDQSSLDDDKTQSAMRFLMRLDQALEFKDDAIHECVVYGLQGLTERGQFASGGFPQVWTDEVRQQPQGARARFPKSWPREYPGHQQYWRQPTLNDNLMRDVIRTLFLASEIYGEARYRGAALAAADFLLAAQLPAPQPAWAQQYNLELEPIWARKFEPPAVTGGESQGVLEILLEVYATTGDAKYLAPIPSAIAYLDASRLEDGRLARFYELQTNRPLFFTREYVLTYDGSDVPTHYAFRTSSRLAKLKATHAHLATATARERKAWLASRTRARRPSASHVRAICTALDARGAWLTDEPLRYHKRPGPVISMRTTVDHLESLAAFLAADD